ncbi:MAG: hypothetical protein AAGL97_02145 [Pseudomonadota bacterium]
MKRLSLSLAAVLPACAAAGADSKVDAYKQAALGVSPLNREIAASESFIECRVLPQSEYYGAICDVCNVDLYADKDLPFNADPDTEAPIIGVKGWATHFYHEIERAEADLAPKIGATGERASKRFETSTLEIEAIETLFDEANAWCQARESGEFRELKNEIEAFVGGLPQ